jgi:3-(3-hydroxy-phenyl)propionate hydroxylase
MTADSEVVDVLVVGAGPTGLTAAHELARFGVRCRIIDKKAAPVQHSQALAVQVRTLETLELMGIAEGWVAAGYPLRELVPRAFGKRLPTVRLDGVESRFSGPLSVGQQVTERLLSEALAARGVRVERGLEAVEAMQNESGVEVQVRGEGGATHALKARWVIDCEGSHSVLREKLGVAFEGARNPHREMIQADAHVASAFPAGIIHFFIDVERVVALFPFDDRGHCRVLCIIPPTDPPRHDAPTLAEVEAEVRRVADPQAVLSDPRWLNRFRTQHRLAAAFRKGRVFFAGDCAHVHVPVGGQGMNYGMQDAFNLGWKLAGVARGELAPWVLETYEMERRPVAEALVEGTERVFHLVAPAGGAGALRQTLLPLVATGALGIDRVQEAIREAMAELQVHYRESALSETHGGGHPIAGERAPDAGLVVADDRRTTTLYTLLREKGWLLLAFSGTHGEGFAEAAAACLGGLPAQVAAFVVQASADGASGGLLDYDHLLHEAFGVKQAALYLVRPDGYLAFCDRLDTRTAGRLDAYLKRLLPAARHSSAGGS